MDEQIRNSLPPAPILPSNLLLAHVKNGHKGWRRWAVQLKKGFCMANKSSGDISRCEIRDDARATQTIF